MFLCVGVSLCVFVLGVCAFERVCMFGCVLCVWFCVGVFARACRS